MEEQITQKEILERLEKVYELNLKNAEGLVRAFERSGDSESLERAKQDREKWERKIKDYQKKKQLC